MTGNVTSLGIGDGGRKIRGIKEPGDPNTVQVLNVPFYPLAERTNLRNVVHILYTDSGPCPMMILLVDG
jgi:hypothetical protein